MSKLLIGIYAMVIGTALTVTAPAASARDHRNWSANIDAPDNRYRTYSVPMAYGYPPVVYNRPAPVYVQTAPLYFSQQPVYVEPVRVYGSGYFSDYEARPHHWHHSGGARYGRHYEHHHGH